MLYNIKIHLKLVFKNYINFASRCEQKCRNNQNCPRFELIGFESIVRYQRRI